MYTEISDDDGRHFGTFRLEGYGRLGVSSADMTYRLQRHVPVSPTAANVFYTNSVDFYHGAQVVTSNEGVLLNWVAVE